MLHIETDRLSDVKFRRDIGIALSDMLQGISGAWDLKAADLAELFVVDQKTARGWLKKNSGEVSVSYSGKKMDQRTADIVDFIQFYDLVAGFIVTTHDQKLWLKTPSAMFEEKSPLEFMKAGTKNISAARLRFDRLSNP